MSTPGGRAQCFSAYLGPAKDELPAAADIPTIIYKIIQLGEDEGIALSGLDSQSLSIVKHIVLPSENSTKTSMLVFDGFS